MGCDFSRRDAFFLPQVGQAVEDFKKWCFVLLSAPAVTDGAQVVARDGGRRIRRTPFRCSFPAATAFLPDTEVDRDGGRSRFRGPDQVASSPSLSELGGPHNFCVVLQID
jgi:hypothetical protein